LSVGHRGRRGGIAGADGGPSTVSVFEAFQDEALLAGVEVRPVYDHARDLPTWGDGPRFNFGRIVLGYHFLAHAARQKKTDPSRQSVYWWIKEWKAERLVDALKLSRASGIPIEKLAGESFEEGGHKPQGAETILPSNHENSPKRAHRSLLHRGV